LHADRSEVRTLIAIAGVLLLLGGLGAIKGAQFATLAAFGREAQEAGPPPEAVAVTAAAPQDWELTLHAVGSLASARGVGVSAEVPGVVTRIHFESGQKVDKGDLLVQLDARVERAELASAIARAELAEAELERTQSVVDAGAAPVAELDAAQAEIDSARADTAALRGRIALKTIRAPFSGRLGIRQVDLGQYLDPGTTVTVLETRDELFADFTLPQKHLDEVEVGMPVRIELGTGETLMGIVNAVEPTIDPVTRAIRLRALVERNGEPELRAGMFVDVEAVLPRRAAFVTVPATAIVHAPYGDSVFVLEDKPEDEPGMRETPQGDTVYVVRQQFVRTGPRRGDFVAIVEGVEAGEKVVSEGAFKLRHHAPAFLGESALPEPQLHPRPDNR
jgi:membrane fusion protein (multidrug efflux system)